MFVSKMKNNFSFKKLTYLFVTFLNDSLVDTKNKIIKNSCRDVFKKICIIHFIRIFVHTSCLSFYKTLIQH